MTPSPVVHMTMNGAGMGGALPGSMTNEECGIREVWAHNLDAEFRTICQIIQKYNFVAMDTEFPGVVARPIGKFLLFYIANFLKKTITFKHQRNCIVSIMTRFFSTECHCIFSVDFVCTSLKYQRCPLSSSRAIIENLFKILFL